MGGAIFRIVAVTGDQYVFWNSVSRSCPDCQYFFDRNRTLLKVLTKDGAPADDSNVGMKYFDFPLSVGKRWTSHQNLRQRNTPDLVPYENTFTVDRYEDVKTKAGTFKAFRIVWEQENKAIYRTWKGYLYRWYSPEVRNWIKQEVRTPNWFQDFELESCSLK